MTKHDTAALVKRARAKLKLTQAEFAEKLGLERRTIMRFERGDDLPLQTRIAIRHMLAARLNKVRGKGKRKYMKYAANCYAWALGEQRSNGFYVRKVVWGLLMASYEKRDNEEIRKASIQVEQNFKRRPDLSKDE
jgi:DNA-binding XRE family transcriptional regulator